MYLNSNIMNRLRSLEQSIEVAKERGLNVTQDGRCKPVNVEDNLSDVCLPRILDKSVKGRVTYVSLTLTLQRTLNISH